VRPWMASRGYALVVHSQDRRFTGPDLHFCIRPLQCGNLTRDPELRYTPAGTAVCQIGLALNRRWKDQAGEPQQEATFVEVTVWGRQAETVASYLTKGRAVAVEGRLQLDTWQPEDGERRSRLKVVAQRVTFLSWANGQPAPGAALGEDVPDWVTEGVER
jgi:single-strand DNA-binding protein